MILTVTLNPLLERRFTFAGTKPGVNRNGKVELATGGKGLNVSRQLKKWNINSLALFFSGGNNGKLLRDCLRKDEINFSSINISHQTRECAVIIDKKNRSVSSYFEADPIVSEKEAEEFKSKLEKMIQNCEIVIFSGSSPSKTTEDIIPFGIETANKYDKVSVCDTYGSNLINAIEASPTIVHNNIEELETSLGIKLNSDNAVKKFISSLYSKGIKRAYITNAEKKFFSSNFDFIYETISPQVKTIDSTGSGDVFVSALIYGWINSLTFDESLQIAAAAGALNAAEFNVANIGLKEIAKLKDLVNTNQIGKKIKIVDDSPK